MSDQERSTPVPPVRRQFSSAPIAKPQPGDDLREWTDYFADVALVLEHRANRAMNPAWRNVASMLGVVGFGLSIALLTWHLCEMTGHCR